MMIALNLSPSPVSVTTPTMIPAPAQVTATFSTPIDPASSAWKNFDLNIWSTIRFVELWRPRNRSYENSVASGCRKLVRTAATVAQNTDITGE